MATMVKEKRKEKKKVKQKPPNSVLPKLSEQETLFSTDTAIGESLVENDTNEIIIQNSTEISETMCSEKVISKQSIVNDNTEHPHIQLSSSTSFMQETEVSKENKRIIAPKEQDMISDSSSSLQGKISNMEYKILSKDQIVISSDRLEDNVGDNYIDLNKRLENIAIPETQYVSDKRLKEIENPDAYLRNTEELNAIEFETHIESDCEIALLTGLVTSEDQTQEDITPSAPVYEEINQVPVVQYILPQQNIEIERPIASSMSIEEAVKIFGGIEIDEVRIMSEREEAIVEEGPVSGPEHPLVDLLSTFRTSIIAVERERNNVASSITNEERARTTLWKIEKRHINVTKECPCGAKVDFKATYDHATLLREKLPAAKLRLEGLLRDVQDSYCHHQHEALLTHCQIEELISETVQSSKAEIREALALVLQALRLSNGAPQTLANALQRWARNLSAALVDQRDMRHLLFLVHHLFRQTRSVQWAVPVVHLSVEDTVSAARIIALLDILLTNSKIDNAVECTEEKEEAWEEVDKHGGGGAVSEGMLRENDLLALLYMFPLRDLVARIMLFTNADIRQAKDYEWGDHHGGHGVLKACCGVRVFLTTLQRASIIHAHYSRLLHALREIATCILLALASLHLHSSHRDVYTQEAEVKILAELEAVFAQGFVLFGTYSLHRLPATLLTDDTARDYCTAFMVGLHDKSSRRIDSLAVETPLLSCGKRLRIIVQASIGRIYDHELAKTVLEFLFQIIKSKQTYCKDGCQTAAQDLMPRLLETHPYLHTLVLHMVAETNQVELLGIEVVKPLSLEMWRPTTGEVRAVLEDWSVRAPHLLEHLLFGLNYMPYTGLPLDVQLSVGSFLCTWVRSVTTRNNLEWCWEVLRRLRVHRSWWGIPLDAPPPDDEELSDHFSMAYGLTATSWGHCMPLICSHGVSALCTLASVRVRDAVHCLAPIMIVMAHSPESVSLTPKFNELFTILLNTGPSLVQRAIGRGGVSGSEFLLRLILKQLESDHCGGLRRGSILSAWMHALWRHSLPTAAYFILDTAALSCREWPQIDAHVALLLQDPNAVDVVTQAVRNANTGPLLCECILRAWHASKENYFYPSLLVTLVHQRTNGQRIHVDNALQQIGTKISAEDLVIYRSATAAMSAPFHHPSHLTLWRLFMHLFLQRPPENLLESAPAVGPLFFSGIMKSRTLNQVKKRLQETAAYHRNEAATLESQQKVVAEVRPSRSGIKSSKLNDDSLLPALSIEDLTGESSGSSGTETSSSEEEDVFKDEDLSKDVEVGKRTSVKLISYHISAEKLLRLYLRWLEDGDNVRALPHHADIARTIPEEALEAGWQHALTTLRPSSEVKCETPTATPVAPPRITSQTLRSPFQTAMDAIARIKDRSRSRRRRKLLKCPLDDVEFKDSRTLVSLVDKHLKDIEKLAQEWYAEVCRISSLDQRLWELVGGLRVPQPLPVLKKQCVKKCKPLILHINQSEWSISTAAERGIKDNRSNARSLIRRLARPRPHAARTVAALHTIARRISNCEAATRVLERVWSAAGACAFCSAAHSAITTLTTLLAERWICHQGKLCADLLSRWSRYSKNSLQQSLCGVIISSRKLRFEEWPVVYIALLRAELPQHMLFSYLSKFEMMKWSEVAETGWRRDVLEALAVAVQRWDPHPDPRHQMLLELLGVHTQWAIGETELCPHVTRCARATVRAALPHSHWTYVTKAAQRIAAGVPFDQLGHLLRELGVMWWEARTGLKGVKAPTLYATYAPYIAQLQSTLLRAFVAAAMQLSYAPERVSLYAWSALQESWAAWVAPSCAAPPLLPSIADEEAYTPMLKEFVDAIRQIMVDCPGTEIYLLQHVFEWTIQTGVGMQSVHVTQESRVQMSALLAELVKLPWTEYQWCYGKCLRVAIQICSSNDKEIAEWCCQTWRNIKSETWLYEVDAGNTDEQLASKLASLLYLFTGTHMPHSQQSLEEAQRLPWWRLPAAASDEALERFFAAHHNPAEPYHEKPQFALLLFACGLSVHPLEPAQFRNSPQSRLKRCCAVSQWVRAACSPPISHHVVGHSTALLDVLTLLAPCLDSSGDEIEELLGRAIVIMCMDPAAKALPVWDRWVRTCPLRMVRACVSASGGITALDYFAQMADVAIKTLLDNKESGGWAEVLFRLRECPWKEPRALLARVKPYAAYACAMIETHSAIYTDNTFVELRDINTNFLESEAILALWICYACRIASNCDKEERTADTDICKTHITQLFTHWSNPPRRSILKVVAMQADTDRPTVNHRLLSRFALCVLFPDNASYVNAFESQCVGPLGGMASWGRHPSVTRLLQLALTLYPRYERYFKLELDLLPKP